MWMCCVLVYFVCGQQSDENLFKNSKCFAMHIIIYIVGMHMCTAHALSTYNQKRKFAEVLLASKAAVIYGKIESEWKSKGY